MIRTGRQHSGAAAGWTAFAACALLLNGAFDIVACVVGTMNDDFLVMTSNHVLSFDTANRACFSLAVGCVVLFVGLALFSGDSWSRTKRRPNWQGSPS